MQHRNFVESTRTHRHALWREPDRFVEEALDRRSFLKALGALLATACMESSTTGIRARETRRRVVRRSRGGLLDLTLDASETKVPIAGRDDGILLAYDGTVPGPLLEARPGDTIRLQFRNHLNEATNLHFHGLHVSPTGNADNIFLQVPAGESQQYEVPLPEDHPAGLFWIHPHLHGSVARQVGGGLAAPLIIRGEIDRIPEIADAPEHVLVLQDFDLDSSGRPDEPSPPELMMGREGGLVLVSGRFMPSLALPRGGLARLRILNASPSRHYRLQIRDHPMHVIGSDGGPLAQTETADDLLLPPGARLDVLVEGARDGGRYELVDLGYDRGMMGMGGGMMRGMTGSGETQRTLATLEYRDSSSPAASIPQRLESITPLEKPDRVRSFRLGMSMMGGGMMGRGMGRGGHMGMRFTIDGRRFDPERIDAAPLLGTIEEWEWINETGMDHPMHLHTNPMQLITPAGEPERAWRDVVLVPASSRTRVRVAFRDYPGKTVQHCHILDHEDLGMMATVLMTEPGSVG